MKTTTNTTLFQFSNNNCGKFICILILFSLITTHLFAQQMHSSGPSSAATIHAGATSPLRLQPLAPLSPGTDIRTTFSGSPQNETTIAGDPNNSNIVVGGMNDFSLFVSGFAGNGVVFSNDGGITYTHHLTGVPLPPAPFNVSGGDPGVAFNSSGRVYYSFIAGGTRISSSVFERSNGVFISSSTDGGVTWSAPVTLASNVFPGVGTVPFEDKPFCASDEYPASPFTDNVYASWTRFYDGAHPNGGTGGGDIFFSRSLDNGLTWSAPVIISSPANEPANAGTGTNGNSFVQGSEPEVEADGDVYVVYHFGGRTNVSRSTDGGVTFGAPTKPFGTAFNVSAVSSPLPFETFRCNAFPNIETDPLRPGSVYVVAADGNGPASLSQVGGVSRPTDAGADIIFSRSTDNGATWIPALILNDDPAGNNQIFPWMAVDPTTGDICVIWYDTRLDPTGPDGIKDLDVFETHSIDGGVTFSPNARLTDVSFDPNTGQFSGNTFIGDYNGLGVSPNSRFHALWTDTRTGEQEIFYDAKGGPSVVVANDNCSDALPIACGAVVTGSTTNATLDIVPSCPSPTTSPGVWYKLTGDGKIVTATTCSAGTLYDTKISVYEGPCGGLACIIGNDDSNCSFGGLNSTVSWLANAGTDYYILVHGFGGSVGDFTLSITCGCLSDSQCADGDACNGIETCDLGTGFCQLGTPVDCDDRTPCTNDGCDPATGNCTHAPLCFDGNPCTNDFCIISPTATGCRFVPKNCDDHDPCTIDFCDPFFGCEHTTILCDDFDPCTDDACVNGACVATPVNCDDGDECTADFCDPLTGTCQNQLFFCVDGLTCTDDACDPAVGCVFVFDCTNDPASCCDDGDACTTDICTAAGCQNIAIVCNDGNLCTEDVCLGGACIFTPIDCSDGDPCTDDFCEQHDDHGHCKHKKKKCDDNNKCTDDRCANGFCVFTLKNCNDNKPCTQDFCDNGHCKHVENSLLCNDNNLCTIDKCEGGNCKYKSVKCDDKNKCTSDGCNPAVGCVFTPIVPCNARKTDDFGMPVANQDEFMLKAYPNPFSEKLNIEFTLVKDSRVKLEIFSITGQRLAVLFEGDVKAAELKKAEYSPTLSCDCLIIYRLQTEQGIYYGKAVMVR